LSCSWFDSLRAKLEQELADQELQLKLWTPRGTAEGASDCDREILLMHVEGKTIVSDTRHTVLTWLAEHSVTQKMVELRETHGPAVPRQTAQTAVLLHDTLKGTANTYTVQVQRPSQAYQRKATTHS